MLRIHFHNVEKTDLDTKVAARRDSEVDWRHSRPRRSDLVSEIVLAEDPDGVIARWKPSVCKIAEATSADLDGPIWDVLGAIEDMPAPDDYQAMDDLIRRELQCRSGHHRPGPASPWG